MENQERTEPTLPFVAKAGVFGGTLALAGLLDALAQLRGAGLIIGGIGGGIVLAKNSPAIVAWLKEHGHLPPEAVQSQDFTWLDRLMGRHYQQQAPVRGQQIVTQVSQELEEMEPIAPNPHYVANGDELAAPRQKRTSMFLFSEVLQSFKPSLDKIYLGTLATGEMVFCRAEELCHVALAGAARGGKSSIMRMLLAQLCYAGARVLILNPHYSRYILDKQEDWTPFHSYLIHDPMECRKYDVIEHYLKQIVEEVLPSRLDKFANSQPIGRPYFIALDELPSIVKHVKNAPEYLEYILREGAKVGIFLIVASQDFLVKTISPSGSGGAVRECYRSVWYVGGDATTAKILLDMPANQILEDEMGRGTVMLRNWIMCKKSSVASVPYVDNRSLELLLGPSTYVPAQARSEEDDLVSGLMTSRVVETDALPVVETTRTYRDVSSARGTSTQRARERAQRLRNVGASSDERETRPERAISPEESLTSEERRVLEAYRAGSRTGNAISSVTDIPPSRVNVILNRIGKSESGLGLIDWSPRKTRA